MASLEESQWREGIDKKIKRIHEFDVWKFILRSEDIKIFISKWAFARKRNKFNEVVRYKTRLMLRNYEQIAGRDYDEIYIKIMRSEISRLLLFLAAKYD
jgi:hypothetical protein